jgi:phthalate 4,5-dioxygenase oxygenase subunit
MAGGAAIGTAEPRIPQNRLNSFEGVVPKSTDWRVMNVSAEELALTGQATSAAE